jgi:hypothetical protein
VNRRIWITGLLLAFILVACEKMPFPAQGKPEPPSVPKVIVEKEKVERTPPPPEVKIRLKKDAKDSYSWELSGSDVDQILKVNEKLRKQLGRDPSK